MKKVTVLALSLLTFNLASAQVTKGSWLLGGNASFSHYRNTAPIFGVPGPEEYIIKIQPKVGVFVFHKVAIGILADWSLSKNLSEQSTALTVGPFLRYYFLPANNKVNILAAGDYQYGFTKYSGSTLKTHGFSLLAGPVMFINPNIAIEFTIGYSKYKFFDYSGSNRTIQAGVGLQIHLTK